MRMLYTHYPQRLVIYKKYQYIDILNRYSKKRSILDMCFKQMFNYWAGNIFDQKTFSIFKQTF